MSRRKKKKKTDKAVTSDTPSRSQAQKPKPDFWSSPDGRLLLIVFIVAMVSLTFGGILSHQFVTWDDDVHILNNPYLKSVSYQSVVDHIWADPSYTHRYIPITYSVWALEAYIDQDISGNPTEHNPWIFHLGSLLIHLLSVIVLFLILQKLVSPVAACFGALLFGLHPIQVESVALVSATDVLLSGLLSFVAIWQYCFYTDGTFTFSKADSATKAARSRARLHYALATLCLSLALLSKPAAVTVPLIVLILDRMVGQRTIKQSLVMVAPWLALVVVYGLWMSSHEQAGRLAESSLWTRAIIAADALTFYMVKIIFPFGLCMDYGRSPDFVFNSNWATITWLPPVAVLAILGWLWYRKSKATTVVFVAVGLFFVAVLPTLGFIPHRFQLASTVVDRYVYVAMMGPALGVAVIVSRSRWQVTAVCFVVLCVLGVTSFQQARVWKNSEALYTHTIAINPNSFPSYMNLGNVLMNYGDTDDAIANYRQAVAVKPDSAEAYYNLAVATNRQGKFDEAATLFEKTLELNPDFPGARAHLEAVREKSR